MEQECPLSQLPADRDNYGVHNLAASIDPNRPYKLSPEESLSINTLLVILTRQDTVTKRKREWEDREAELEHVNQMCKTALRHLDDKVLGESHPEVLEKLEAFRNRVADAKSEHKEAIREFCNEKQRQRNQRIHNPR
ncbi:hypothetical protein MferCBS49748_003794 [Microsporum ferrugineum]